MSDIKESDIRSRVQQAVTEVFGTMLSMQVTLADSDPPDPGSTHRTLGAVHFAGEVTGSFNIQVNTDFARRMTARMLGIELEEIEEEENVTDLIAEITNTLGGNLKSALNDQGFSCAISTPFLTSGTDFTIEPLKGKPSQRVVFLHEQEPLIVEFGLKLKEPSAGEPDPHMPALKATAEAVDFEKLNALDMKTRLSEAVVETLGTVLSMEPELTDTIPASAQEGGRTAAAVSFVGDASGLVNIQVTDELTRIMAANKPSPVPSELEEDQKVRDLIERLVNGIGGNLKSAITDTGLTCELSPPRFTSGTDFKVESSDMQRYDRLAFRLRDHFVLVEMGMKISEILQVAGQVSQDVHDPADDSAPAVEETASDPGSPAPAVDQAIPAADTPAPSTPTDASADKAEEAEADQNDSPDPQSYDLDLILDIPLQILVELGRTKIQIQDLLQLKQGSTVKLTKLDGASVDILANDTLIARGMVVIQNEKYAVQVTDLASRLDRIKSLN
jgi:flagellar motor switch protein FliN/FliY